MFTINVCWYAKHPVLMHPETISAVLNLKSHNAYLQLTWGPLGQNGFNLHGTEFTDVEFRKSLSDVISVSQH